MTFKSLYTQRSNTLRLFGVQWNNWYPHQIYIATFDGKSMLDAQSCCHQESGRQISRASSQRFHTGLKLKSFRLTLNFSMGLSKESNTPTLYGKNQEAGKSRFRLFRPGRTGQIVTYILIKFNMKPKQQVYNDRVWN